MPRCQPKNTIKALFPLELSHPTTAGPKYSNIAEAQEKDLKTNCIEMIEVLSEEMNKSFTKSRKAQQINWRKWIDLSKTNRKTQRNNWRKWINALKQASKQTNKNPNSCAGQLWHTPLIPSLWRQLDFCEYEISLFYRMSSRTAKAVQRNPFLNRRNKPQNNNNNNNKRNPQKQLKEMCKTLLRLENENRKKKNLREFWKPKT